MRLCGAWRALLLCLLLALLLSPGVRGVGRKKLSDKELAELEDQWFEDEEDDPNDLSHWRKGPDGQRVPPKPSTKSEMAFVNLRRPITKDATSKWAAEKADLLTSGGVDVKGYSVEAGKVLFVAERGFKDMTKVQRFVLKQDGVVDFEWSVGPSTHTHTHTHTHTAARLRPRIVRGAALPCAAIAR